ncbi:nucleoside recognition domain-containing protein [Candidatus Deferrimicrobium sp.]|uniref:nucleoside recognition domain-containing protein n=1 Tax=Candidatus Deferrimicrobium sp. TaxID=3060586 RepID=UPI002ED9F5EC
MTEPGANTAAEEPIPDIPTRIRTGLSAGLETSLKIIKVSVPLYVAVTLLKETPFLGVLGKVFAPVMGIFGLPGEAAFAFVAAFLLNLYAAIAVIVPLHLTPFQVTQCGLMMGVAHNLVVEGGVLSTTGARGGVLTLCRLVIACAAGLLLRGLWSLWETAASWAMGIPGLS